MIAPIAGGLERQVHGSWIGEAFYASESSMGDIDGELATAAQHVADARRIVGLQRANILKLKAQGRATPDHELTLQALLGTLAQMESHAHALGETAKRLERPRRLLH